MDTSEKYLKMCGKAEEIQKEFKGLHGDYYTPKNNYPEKGKAVIQGSIGMFLIDYRNAYFCTDIKDAIWLPRQDQLQEMISSKWRGCFIDFQWWYQNTDVFEITSFEQLWLAFVYHEKYHKKWDSKKEEWVKNCKE